MYYERAIILTVFLMHKESRRDIRSTGSNNTPEYKLYIKACLQLLAEVTFD